MDEFEKWLNRSIDSDDTFKFLLEKHACEVVLAEYRAFKAKAVEPLEKLAERKGASMAYAVDSSGTLYSEAAARKFLEGLNDVREGEE